MVSNHCIVLNRKNDCANNAWGCVRMIVHGGLCAGFVHRELCALCACVQNVVSKVVRTGCATKAFKDSPVM